MKKCPSKPKPEEPYINKGVNLRAVEDAFVENRGINLRDIADKDLSNILGRIDNAHRGKNFWGYRS